MVPILTSRRVEMPTTTFTLTCNESDAVRALQSSDGAKQQFALYWKRHSASTVGSLCEVTSIVSLQVRPLSRVCSSTHCLYSG